MSNEEAILVLQNDAYVLYEDDMPYDRQAYYMAIKALEEKRIKTNSDRIRSMTDEELANWLLSQGCKAHNTDEWCKKQRNCRACWLEWLKEECES